jgi:hypothetical protein
MTIKIICNNCQTENEYSPEDVNWEPNGPDDPGEYFLDCKTCHVEIGSRLELQTLIDHMPDYEPDPDAEYDAQEEQRLLNL